MPSPEPDHPTAAAPEAPRHPQRATTLAWLALVLLTGLSVLAAGWSHGGHGGPGLLPALLSAHGQRLVMTLVVAAIAWVKALLLIHHYLQARQAGPRFHRIVLLFAALAPLGLVLSALREAWLA